MTEETYIGDGCYASFDGWQFRLRAPRSDNDDVVFLGPRELTNFLGFVKDIYKEEFTRLLP